MSWSGFKSAMASVMKNHDFGKDYPGWAGKLTTEYDKAVKAGKTNVTNIPLQMGQTSAMRALLTTHLQTQQNSKQKTLLEICGPAVIAYWTGAMIMPIPPGPPCPGTISNVSVIVAPVTSPGSWSPPPSDKPTDDVNEWLDRFISCAKKHMNTVSGLHNCISLYPGSPPTPGPCVQNWSGYKVP